MTETTAEATLDIPLLTDASGKINQEVLQVFLLDSRH